jgi:hypothetical protein
MITNRVLGTVLLGINEQVNCSDCISAWRGVFEGPNPVETANPAPPRG